jgi:2-(1,2-epoxy-1,2-dihydrophenyl)acetyl-CoA isomerase
MKNSDLIETYPGFFVSELHEDTLRLKFSGNFFHNATSFDQRDFISDYFERISHTREIKTIVLHSAYNESGIDEYLHFFLFECPERLCHSGFSNTMDRYELHRFCNFIDQTILNIVELDKIVIHICRGNVLSLFMNISLACDFRIAATDTVFYNIFKEIGMLPKGGGPFILSKMLGLAKAKELLLLKNQIAATQALEYGIVDLIVPPENLEETAMKIACDFGNNQDGTLRGVKRLANYSIKDLNEYLKFETEEIIKVGRGDQFDDI